MHIFPEGIDTEELLKLIREISWITTDLLKSYNQISKNSLDSKKLEINELNTGPVTSADLEANKIILNGIKEKYPEIPWLFLSEENVKGIKYDYLKDNNWVWIIDPLDGTRDFIDKTGEYATHISLTYKKKNIFGAILIPSKEELWFYLEGVGSWCELRDLKQKNFNRVNNKEINELTIVTSRSHFHDELKMIINKLNFKRTISMGSIGYKITSLIRGDADVYISYSEKGKSSPKDWDMAAPEAIIKGFGGRFTDLYGNQLSFLKNENYRQDGVLVASMSNKHKEICNKIKNLLK